MFGNTIRHTVRSKIGIFLILLFAVAACQRDYFVPVPKPVPETADPTETLEARYVSSAPDKISSSYWKTADYLPVTLQDLSTGLLYPDGILNATGVYGGLADFNAGDSVNLRLQAAYDDTKLYILLEWDDNQKDASRFAMLFNGHKDPLKPQEDTSGWTGQRNADQVALSFNISTVDFDQQGCQVSCHGNEKRTLAGSLDIWNWNLALSEPLGYAIDRQCNSTGLLDDAGTTLYSSNPLNDNMRSGPRYSWSGTPQNITKGDGTPNQLDPGFYLFEDFTQPFVGDASAGVADYEEFCGETCHGVHGEGFGPDLDGPPFNKPGVTNRLSDDDYFTFGSSIDHSGRTTFNKLTTQQLEDILAVIRGFSGVPSKVLRTPDGSNADILAKSNVLTGRINPDAIRYRVLLIRDLQTGQPDDVQFDIDNKKEYTFGIALMDGDGVNHVGSLVEVLTFIER